MRSTIIVAPAFAALTWASPVQKREGLVTSQEVEVATQGTLFITGSPVARVAAVDAGASSNTLIIADSPSFNTTDPVILPVEDDGDDDDDDDIDNVDEDDLEKRDAQKNAVYYRTAAIKRHNQHRANHGAQPVTWSKELADAAMKSAQRCTFAHFMDENGLRYGQNLALGYAAPNIAGIISDGWYSEVKDYSNNYGQAQPDYGNNMQNFAKWGHFTQLVWKDTSKIGCATWRCDSVKSSATDSTPMPKAYGGDVTYCNYQGPGNYGGEYAANVGAPMKTQNIKPTQGVNQKKIAQAYSKRTGQKWMF